ncbi:MAG: ATP-binding cassette domain-containing protein, partial [Oscillospiraceae bacterium]|nr:ATP-binding cassette domain-containing protein [Oscillospiraceae bacterium]
MSAIIEAMHIRKLFGDLEVLRDMSVTVEEGEVVCLIGPSGSGKSTFLRCLNRLENIQGGTIKVLGEDIASIKEVNRFRANIGMVFQHFNLFPNYTVLGNMTLAPVTLRKFRRQEAV